jgi:TusE/DsrC/DsvC family sulfur relay protein
VADILKYIVSEGRGDSDPNGYLLRLDDWSEEIARDIAADEGIELGDAHWEILHFLRRYYSQYGIAPNVRALSKAIAAEFGDGKASRKYLYSLFPLGPSRQGCRIAGLPQPNDCIDGLD